MLLTFGARPPLLALRFIGIERNIINYAKLPLILLNSTRYHERNNLMQYVKGREPIADILPDLLGREVYW